MEESFDITYDRIEKRARVLDVLTENLGVDYVTATHMLYSVKTEGGLDACLGLCLQILSGVCLDSVKESRAALIWVESIEYFKELSGMSDAEFGKYFNENDWSLYKDDIMIRAMMDEDAQDTVNSFGAYLSERERIRIMERYNEKWKGVFGL